MFHKAVNLTADRAVLVKKLLKLEEKEPTGLATSDYLSPSTGSSENASLRSGEPIRPACSATFDAPIKASG